MVVGHVALNHMLRSLVAPGKQGPADDGKRLDFLSPAMDVVYRKVYLKGRESEGGVGSRLGGIFG